jgi:predicted membrane-bound mannosyltransferase
MWRSRLVPARHAPTRMPAVDLETVSVCTALALLLLAWPLFLDIPLLDPDEGLHASIAQEMLERGDWITPSFLGQPFLDKPIFYFWAQIASIAMLGQHEAAVRLPSLFFGALGALATGLLGRQLFGARAGLMAGAMQATMLGRWPRVRRGDTMSPWWPGARSRCCRCGAPTRRRRLTLQGKRGTAR